MRWSVTSAQGDKYPYDPFYGSFSPRVGVAWNPSFSKATVVRGGYGRIYGRLNGVDLVLVPLLGVGLIQPVQCQTGVHERYLRFDQPNRVPTPSASGWTATPLHCRPRLPPCLSPLIRDIT